MVPVFINSFLLFIKGLSKISDIAEVKMTLSAAVFLMQLMM